MKQIGLKKCFFLAAFALAAIGQVTTGRLEGTVTDPQGAAVPAAAGKVVNTQNGQNLNLVTDYKGFWALPSLPTALYTVTVDQPGLKTFTIQNVNIHAALPSTAKAV